MAAVCGRDDANYAPLADNLRRLRAARDARGRALEIIEMPLPARRVVQGVGGWLQAMLISISQWRYCGTRIRRYAGRGGARYSGGGVSGARGGDAAVFGYYRGRRFGSLHNAAAAGRAGCAGNLTMRNVTVAATQFSVTPDRARNVERARRRCVKPPARARRSFCCRSFSSCILVQGPGPEMVCRGEPGRNARDDCAFCEPSA